MCVDAWTRLAQSAGDSTFVSVRGQPANDADTTGAHLDHNPDTGQETYRNPVANGKRGKTAFECPLGSMGVTPDNMKPAKLLRK